MRLLIYFILMLVCFTAACSRQELQNAGNSFFETSEDRRSSKCLALKNNNGVSTEAWYHYGCNRIYSRETAAEQKRIKDQQKYGY